ncbi:saccharopine dehydrogenase family protein [Hydrogenophaga palleronii]|uniref:saccharopine dehydrogenase family protein n=1 Tax=Hydrogenophaga palleronii TaxID=65655 RepID=UPI00082655AC|nr:saccharopine dehydrogenase NADP-binding domain-containing protein [Hydrogenophaga palleronii]
MRNFRVLVVGGYGFFGSRLVQRLAREPALSVLVAGRDPVRAEALVNTLQPQAQAQLQALALDVHSDALPQALQQWRPDVLVHTSGPFQGQGYDVAEACIRHGVHYIDLADGRAFVTGITALDARARAAGVLVTSGASSVPALSSAVVDRLAEGMARLHAIDIGISPGNRTERGLSTVQGILSYCGQPILHVDGSRETGWARSYRQRYAAPVGTRLLSPCEVPDIGLLPSRYPGAPRIRFGAGLELAWLHRGMNLMAMATRIGLVRNWAPYASWLNRAADLFKHLGSDAGAMHVQVHGLDRQGQPLDRRWELLALDGDGPYVPTLAAVALVKRLRNGGLPAGAMPCLGLLSLDECMAGAAGLAIHTRRHDTTP